MAELANQESAFRYLRSAAQGKMSGARSQSTSSDPSPAIDTSTSDLPVTGSSCRRGEGPKENGTANCVRKT